MLHEGAYKSMSCDALKKALTCLLVGLTCIVWMGGRDAVASEAASDWFFDDYGQLRLIANSDHVGASGTVLLGVQFRLYKGWKTYWRTPGESGIPPEFDWIESQNIENARVQWPVPLRISEAGSEAFGYKREIIFPVQINAAKAGEAIEVELQVSYGVCRDICRPATAQLSLSLPALEGPVSRNQHARHIDRFISRVPKKNGTNGLFITGMKMSEDEKAVEVTLTSTSSLAQADVAIEVTTAYRLGPPQRELSSGGKKAILRLPFMKDPDALSLVGKTLSVVAWDKAGRAVQAELALEPYNHL